MTQIKSPDMLQEIKKAYLEKQAQYERQVLVCGGAGCVSCHCQEVKDALDVAVAELGLADKVDVIVTGCIGICAVGPVLVVQPDNVLYTNMDPDKVREIAQRHLLGGEIVEEYTFFDHTQNKRVANLDDIGFFREHIHHSPGKFKNLCVAPLQIF